MFRIAARFVSSLLILSTIIHPLASELHAHQKRPVDPDPRRPLVQLALLLDTSNSMDGLIAQAKAQLWRVVNELIACERDGRAPRVQVALYEYGNNSISAGQLYVRQVMSFTSDLDLVSERLFALTTNGGDEYCGTAIRDAVQHLEWDRHSDVYKAIFIAGNEPFTQGPVPFQQSVAWARDKDIIVNTIFCGNAQEGVATQWMAGALSGQGGYHAIDPNASYAAIRAPQDDEIARLGRQLNDTFIPYGERGGKAAARQAMQDQMAYSGAGAPAAAPVERSIYKAQEQYAAEADWDLIGSIASSKMKTSEVKKEALPEPLRALDQKELDAHVRKKMKDRENIQGRIQKLSAERRRYIAEEEKKRSDQGSLGEAMLKAVREQAAKKNLKFKA